MSDTNQNSTSMPVSLMVMLSVLVIGIVALAAKFILA